MPETEELLHRAIECGAMIDPWNILGFQGNISLFPALEMDMLEPVLLDALGPPTEVLSDNDALVYEYRLSGSEEPRHVARLVVQFDTEGVRPLQVESVYGRYRSVTDLEAATTRIYIK